MLETLHIKDVGPASELAFDLAPRLNILTGDNGLGKTFILSTVWWALTRTWAGKALLPQRGPASTPRLSYTVRDRAVGGPLSMSITEEYQFPLQRWSITSCAPSVKSLPHERISVPRPEGFVIFARARGGFALWDSARNSVPTRYEIAADGSFTEQQERNGRKTLDAFHFTPPELWDGLADGERVLCNGLIRDWVAWQIRDSEAFKRLKRVLKVLSPPGPEHLQPGEPTRISIDDVRDIPTLALPYGNVPVTHASEGMKRILLFSYLLVWAWEEHVRASALLNRPPTREVVFLIDEAEAHLHPSWQRSILPAIMEVVGALDAAVNVQVVVTTHAPLVLASLEPHFDQEKDALFSFDLKDSEVVVEKVPWRSMGDASNWLTSDVFDLKIARSREAEEAILQAMAAFRKPTLPIDEARAIHHKLRASLGETDPFWGRWLMIAEKAGIKP